MDLTDKEICDRLGKIGALPTCTNWSRGFADSIREQWTKGYTLSTKQRATCFRILQENSPEEVEKTERWAEDYNTIHKSEALIVATYYREQSAGYYGAVADGILAGKVPVRQKFLKMMNNKYAKKVLAELERKPRFTIDDHIIPNSKFLTGYSFSGAMMQTREGVGAERGPRTKFALRGGIILGYDNKIHSAAKGSKRILVLPFGSTQIYYCEERYLKLKPKVKKKKVSK